MPNRLGGALSPYLRQHADNPVDWWPWCDEAFAEARRRDVPVLLSVGYAACHWCHVMAHESFEDPASASLMNDRFVSIKVDREERPDIDAVYMAATQALSGQGGWPMTVLLDHDGRAFYAGTYFPPAGRRGMPSFTDVLLGVDRVWRADRGRVQLAADQVEAVLASHVGSVGDEGVGSHDAALPPLPDVADVTAAVDQLAGEFDRARGGFGGAPKFPPSMVLEFLLRADALTAREGRRHPRALDMAVQTMRSMARGGLYDQLGGGFARYSVDDRWVVPHFEKMLYDNALLLRAYLHWWRATGDRLAERVVRETAGFLLEQLRTPEGAFASSLDADSAGQEGAFYVWTRAQLTHVLGSADGAWVAELCEVTEAGTFEDGASVLQLRADPGDPVRWEQCRSALRRAREGREHPARDDKVVAAWNGLAVAALAEAGALLDEPGWLDAAATCAGLLLDRHWDPAGGRLVRVSLGGRTDGAAPAVLEDHGDLAEGLLALYQCTGDPRWVHAARELLDVVAAHFADGRGGYFDTADDAPTLVHRPRDPFDAVTPSGGSAVASATLSLASLDGSTQLRSDAERALTGLLRYARASPRYAGWAWAACTALVAGPHQVAVVVPGGEVPGSADSRAHASTAAGTRIPSTAHGLHGVALRSTSPGLVVAVAPEGESPVGLLRGRPSLDGLPTAHPCRALVCDLPVTDPDRLRRVLGD